MKTVIFRADASITIGSGHVMRCLTLAHVLRQKDWFCSFFCQDVPGHMMDYIIRQGYPVQTVQTPTEVPDLPQSADWLVIDHYGFDQQSEKKWRPAAKNILVISDFADRTHDCDLLLDQNYHQPGKNNYESLVPPKCRCLIGPHYALLREEFAIIAQDMRQRTGDIKQILVSFGGSDPTGETIKTLRALQIMKAKLLVDVVVGSSNSQRIMIEEMCSQLPGATVHCQTSHMAELMNVADLAIGAGGSTTWERCWLGLPALVTIVADNQAEITTAVASTGAIHCLGEHKFVTQDMIIKVLSELLTSPENVQAMSQAAFGIMGADGKLGTWRVVQAMEE